MQASLNLVLYLIPFFLAKNLDSVFSANEVSSDRSVFVFFSLASSMNCVKSNLCSVHLQLILQNTENNLFRRVVNTLFLWFWDIVKF